jgi:arylsulfatase A-like enzyme
MNRLKYSFIISLTFFLVGTAPVINAADERPNVLFISLDDMNDWLGCYGGHPDAVTPNIDKLAERAVLFTNAHCVSPICGPSRASVLTGMRPETTGVYHNKGTYIDYVPDAVTFPEHFRENGYRTLASGKVDHGLGEPNPRLWDANGPDCGVLGTPFVGDELHTEMMQPTREINRGALKITLPANGGLSAIDRPNNTWDSFDWAPLDVPETDYPDRQIADWGVEQLAKESGKPMLLALGFYKPHQPFFAPRKYFDLYDSVKIQLPATIEGDLGDIPAVGRELATQPWTSGTHKTVTDHGAWQEATHAYLATVSFVDSLVGRVIDGLDRGPHADNTWIVLWSDHGWSLGEKEHWGKHVPWRESVRVPLMIVPPKNAIPNGFTPGARCDALVSLLDLYPTLNDMCKLPDRTELEGRSLLPLIENSNKEWEDTVVSTIGRGTHSVTDGDRRSEQSIVLVDSGAVVFESRDIPNDVPREGHQKDAEFYGYRIPSLLVSQRGTVLAFAERRFGHHDHGQNDIVLRRSSDGGNTWGGEIVVFEDGLNSINDPLTVQLDNGRILMMFARFPYGRHARTSGWIKMADLGYGDPKSNVMTYTTYSDDDGLTWSEPVDISEQVKPPHWINANSPGGMIQIKKGPHRGRIITPLWGALVPNDPDGTRRWEILVAYSDDNGKTWTRTDPLADLEVGYPNECQIAEAANGNLVIVSRNQSGDLFRKKTISSDGGETWPPLEIDKSLPSVACMGSLIRGPEKEDGSWDLFASFPSNTGRENGQLALSRDHGRSFEIKAIVAGQFAYSATQISPDSKDLLCLYETRDPRVIRFCPYLFLIKL